MLTNYWEYLGMQVLSHHSFITGGRGYGKIRAQREAVQRWRNSNSLRIPHKTPRIGKVVWLCRRPTDPVYPKGSNGWFMEQAEARISPELRKQYRRIADNNAAIMDRFAEILGVKPDGNNSP